MGGQHPQFVDDAEALQDVRGWLKRGQVRGAAHGDANQWLAVRRSCCLRHTRTAAGGGEAPIAGFLKRVADRRHVAHFAPWPIVGLPVEVDERVRHAERRFGTDGYLLSVPSRLTITAAGARRPVSPSGKPSTARTWLSNCEVQHASMV